MILPSLFLFDREPARFMAEKNVGNFLHERGPVSIFPVRGIEDDKLFPAWQRVRSRSARP